MSSLNWDIERECHIFCPLGVCRLIMHSESREAADSESHRICSSPPLLIILPHSPTSPSSPQPLPQMPKSPSPGTPTIAPAPIITSGTSWRLQAASHSKPRLRTHCIANTPHSPLSLRISQKGIKKSHLPHHSPPKSLDHPQKRSLAPKQPHDPATPTANPKAQSNSNPRPDGKSKESTPCRTPPQNEP
jgi:hypothetical protein